MSLAEPITISLGLDASGWAALQISTGAGSCTISGFGDGSDAFGDLARAALTVVTGGWKASVSLDGEPNEWRLVLVRLPTVEGPDRLHLRVLEFRDILEALPESEGVETFSVEVETDAFGHAVLAALRSLSMDLETFNARWRVPEGFPARATEALAAALRVGASRRSAPPVVFDQGWLICGDNEKPD